MNDPAAVHQRVQEFNWDGDLALLWPIVQSPDTEYATALLIYWRLEGPWIDRSGTNSEAIKLHDVVEGKLLAGEYPKGSLRYDPVVDNSLSQVQVAKLKRGGFPMPLLAPNYQENLT